MRRVRSAWVGLTGTGAAASVAFGLLVFVAVLASLAIPRESVVLRNDALQRTVTSAQPDQRTITGFVNESAMQTSTGVVLASDITTVGDALRAQLVADGVPLASNPPAWGSLTSGLVQVTGAARSARTGVPQFEITYRSGLPTYSRLVAGQYPVRLSVPGNTPEVQAAVTTATAARFGLRIGSVMTMGSTQLTITGIIQPVNTGTSFWTEDPLAATPELTPAAAAGPAYWTGAIFVGAKALPALQFGTGEVRLLWGYTVALGGLTAGQAGEANSSINSMIANGESVQAPDLVDPVNVSVTSKVPAVLSPFLSEENAVTPVLELLYVSLAVLGAVVVLLGARLVAQRRAAEFTLMRARGASLRQLAWLVLRSSVIIAAIAGAVGAAIAIGLTLGGGDAWAWWLAGVTIAVTVLGPVLISVLPQRVASPATGRPVRYVSSRTREARRVVIEVLVVAASVGGLVVLRSQGLGAAGNGLYASAAPVLIAIPVAVVVLRLYPLLARELARAAGLSRGVVAFVGLARATRTPPGTVLPSFALVLVLAMVAFPSMVSTAETRSQVAESWQQVPADAIVQAPSSDTLSPALLSQIASVPGVVSTAPVAVEDGTLTNGTEVTLAFADPAAYAAVVDEAPGTRFPLAALSGAQSAGAVPAVATPDAAQLLGTGGSVSIGGGSPFTIRLVGQIAGVPDVAPAAVLLPMSALGPNPSAPNLVLIAGPGLDGARLNQVVRTALPGALVTLHSAALTALTTSPVPQAAQTALIQGIGAAAGLGVLVLLLSLLLTAASRETTLSRLATMGLRRWQAQLLLATETLPPVVAAAIGGVACAWLLVPLVGPELNLAAFSGSGASAAVTAAVFPMVMSAVGLVLAALIVLTIQAMITYHRGSSRALRIAE